MRVEDAPPAGWYPDPEGGSRLRWWEGTDWADRWRAPPTPGVVELRLEYQEDHAEDLYPDYSRHPQPPQYTQLSGLSRTDSELIIAQVRQAAREEVERAAHLFGQEVRSAASEVGPLISTYTNRFMRWVKFFSTVAVIVFIAWLAFQIFAQASLFEWIGDRIDNLTNDDESGLAAVVLAPW
jgi:hypothetical protein